MSPVSLLISFSLPWHLSLSAPVVLMSSGFWSMTLFPIVSHFEEMPLVSLRRSSLFLVLQCFFVGFIWWSFPAHSSSKKSKRTYTPCLAVRCRWIPLAQFSRCWFCTVFQIYSWAEIEMPKYSLAQCPIRLSETLNNGSVRNSCSFSHCASQCCFTCED